MSGLLSIIVLDTGHLFAVIELCFPPSLSQSTLSPLLSKSLSLSTRSTAQTVTLDKIPPSQQRFLRVRRGTQIYSPLENRSRPSFQS